MTTGLTPSTSRGISSPGLSLWGETADYDKVVPRISNNNAICLGQKEIEDKWGAIVQYSGEILDGKKATGDGAFTDSGGNKYSGHFVDDMLEGACESPNI